MLTLVVLSSRVLVESVFQQFYPLWTRTKEGIQAIMKMDEVVLQLLDPHGYHRNLTRLQSSISAVRLLANYQSKAHPPSYR